MNNSLIIASVITTMIASCNPFSSEPDDAAMRGAVIAWKKLDEKAVTNFKKTSCTAGRISHLYRCKFFMTVSKGPISEQLPVAEANFVSHDSGKTWTAYP